MFQESGIKSAGKFCAFCVAVSRFVVPVLPATSVPLIFIEPDQLSLTVSTKTLVIIYDVSSLITFSFVYLFSYVVPSSKITFVNE